MKVIKGNFSVGLILNKKNQILLQKKDEGYWFWPNMWSTFGGKVKKEETPMEGLERELKEECGLKVKDIKFFCEQKFSDVAKTGSKKNTKRKGKLYYFTCKFDGNLKDIKINEGVGFSLFSEKEIEKYIECGLVIPYGGKIIKKMYSEIKNNSKNEEA